MPAIRPFPHDVDSLTMNPRTQRRIVTFVLIIITVVALVGALLQWL